MRFLDANVILRYLTRDDPEKAKHCLELFRKAKEKEVVLTTSESVIAEVVYVLSSPKLYNLSRERIRELLLPILDISGLEMLYKRTYRRALDLYASYAIDFEDAVSLAHMERQEISDIISYDKDFDGIEGIRRVEP